MLNAQDIHAAVSWPDVLEQLGIDRKFLVKKHGPCPACGGKDRFRFDNRDGRGTFYCNRCGSGDGFKLLELVHGWVYADARKRIIEAAGLSVGGPRSSTQSCAMPMPKDAAPAKPSGRVEQMLRTASSPEAVEDVIDYLRFRKLWPLPTGCSLRAHAGADYWNIRDGQSYRAGRYPALLADIRDVNGELVTAHVTYLEHGRKLDADGRQPRKLLGKLTGRRGCAARLVPADGNTLGIAEGIETALAAQALHNVPVWAATNATLLTKFEPPPSVHHVIIFADRDVTGLEAALELTARLDGRASVETRTPPTAAGDWADVLMSRRS